MLEETERKQFFWQDALEFFDVVEMSVL